MKRTRIVVAALVTLMVFLVAGCTPAAKKSSGSEAGSSSASGTALRVASWNVDSKAHPDITEMSAILDELGIEIMGFQEIDVNNTRNDYDMVADFVNDNYPYVHFAKGRDFANGGFGVGATGKYEFLEESSFPIESTSSKATKTLERVLFEKDGKQIAFYVTHTSWENTALRKRQIAQILERVRQDDAPYIILVADWNADQSLYEYAPFMEDFNIANGKNSKWFNTFNGVDETMKTKAVDNIITTKNISIETVDTYHSDMADHDMIYADLVLSDEPASFSKDPNRALGQLVTASSSATGSDPLMATDSYDSIAWKSEGGNKEESLTVELPYVVDLRDVEIAWSERKPASYDVSVSQDGIEFEKLAKGEKPGSKDTVELSGTARFVRIDMTTDGKSPVGVGEVYVHGDVVRPENVDTTELLSDGGFEEGSDAWTFETAGEADPEVEDQAASEFESVTDFDAHDGAKAMKITRTGEDGYGEGLLSQKIDVEANSKYLLSFWQKTDTLNSDAFTYEIVQYDADGEPIDLYHVTLADNLNLAKDWRRNDYTFTTAPNAASIEVIFHVGAGEGSLWLDDVSLRQDTQIENIALAADKTVLAVGETATVTAQFQPEDYDDLTFEWVTGDEKVATVSDDGTVTATGKGSTYVGLRSTSDLTAESLILITVE